MLESVHAKVRYAVAAKFKAEEEFKYHFGEYIYLFLTSPALIDGLPMITSDINLAFLTPNFDHAQTIRSHCESHLNAKTKKKLNLVMADELIGYCIIAVSSISLLTEVKCSIVSTDISVNLPNDSQPINELPQMNFDNTIPKEYATRYIHEINPSYLKDDSDSNHTV